MSEHAVALISPVTPADAGRLKQGWEESAPKALAWWVFEA